MEDIIIKVRSKLINYDLRFEHNLNIIRGDSATGKSTLIRIIDNKKSSDVSIESNYNIFHLTSEILEGGFKLNENTVYLMDENDGIEEKIVINELNKDRYKFILILRDLNLENVSYGIDQIYYLQNSGKFNFNKNKYNINLNKNRLESIKLNELNQILVEDSGSGLDFYSNYKNFIVYSSNGNGNINNMVKTNQIIALDSIAFGPYIKNLIDIIKNRNILIISPKTFEWLILTSKIFKVNDNFLENEYNKLRFEGNKEKFYEKILKLESNKINMNYSKSKLNKKFLEEVQFDKINERVKELFEINLKNLNKEKKNDKWGWE